MKDKFNKNLKSKDETNNDSDLNSFFHKFFLVLTFVVISFSLFFVFVFKTDIPKDDKAEELKIKFDTLLESDLDIYYDKVLYFFNSYHLVYKYEDFDVYNNYTKLCNYYSTECYVEKNNSIYDIDDVTINAQKLFAKDGVVKYDDFKIYNSEKLSKPAMLDKRSIIKLNKQLIKDLDKLDIVYNINLSSQEFDIVFNVSIDKLSPNKPLTESAWEVRELLRVYIETIYNKSIFELDKSSLYVMPAIYYDNNSFINYATRISNIKVPKEVMEKESLNEI